MANFTTKSIKQIYDGFISSFTVLQSKQGDDAPILEKSLVKSLGYAMAGVAGMIWKLLIWTYKQSLPQTCELPSLKYWGDLIGVSYKDGQSASLIIELIGVKASYLPTGTVYKDLISGLIFKTASQASASAGVITATVVCTTGGDVGNLAIGTILDIANPYDGIPQTATVKSVSIQGTPDEEVETYRQRVLTKYRSNPQGGSALDYYNWASEVFGITDVLPYTITEGQVDIYLVSEGSGRNRTPSGSVSPNPFPSWSNGVFTDYTGSGLFLSVANSIEGSKAGIHDRRPMCARVKLFAPNYTPFSIAITGLTETSYNDAIKEALVASLDLKRPHIKVLGYKESNAKINKLALSAEVSEIIGDETFTTFTLKDSSGTEISEATLGVGCLAYLSSLSINGVNISL